MFNISGAVGILVITTLGGRLFDSMSPKAPFMVVGAINALVMLAGIVVRATLRSGAQKHGTDVVDLIILKIGVHRKRKDAAAEIF